MVIPGTTGFTAACGVEDHPAEGRGGFEKKNAATLGLSNNNHTLPPSRAVEGRNSLTSMAKFSKNLHP